MNIQKVLAIALFGAGLASCSTYSGQHYAWSGNPKFTTGVAAPSLVGREAAAHRQAGSENPTGLAAADAAGVNAAAHERSCQRRGWSGNPKFTTGILAPSLVVVGACP